MNPAPGEQTTDNRQQITATPIPTVASSPPPTTPIANSQLPITSPPPPAGPPTSTPPAIPPSPPTIEQSSNQTIDNPPPHHKFPFMMITLFLAVVLTGLAGSFLFLSYKGKNGAKTPAQIQITPPATVTVTQITPTESTTNPFATGSSDLTTNPFASPSTVTNPFGTYQNPFGQATISATPNPVTNPFE